MSKSNQLKEQRKKELNEKVDNLAKTVHMMMPRNEEEAAAYEKQLLYVANIDLLSI